MRRSQRRCPNLTPWDRVILGFCTLLSPRRLGEISVILKTAILLRLQSGFGNKTQWHHEAGECFLILKPLTEPQNVGILQRYPCFRMPRYDSRRVIGRRTRCRNFRVVSKRFRGAGEWISTRHFPDRERAIRRFCVEFHAHLLRCSNRLGRPGLESDAFPQTLRPEAHRIAHPANAVRGQSSTR